VSAMRPANTETQAAAPPAQCFTGSANLFECQYTVTFTLTPAGSQLAISEIELSRLVLVIGIFT